MINQTLQYISDKTADIRLRLAFLHSSRALRFCGYALRFILGAMFGAARIFSDRAPFGPGFVAAAGGGIGGLFALLGATLGAAAAGGFAWAAKYCAAGALSYAALTIFSSVPSVRDKPWFPPLIVSVITAVIGIVYLPDYRFTLASTAYYICEVVLAGGTAYFYKIALAPKNAAAPTGEQRRVSVLIFMSTLCVALSHVEIFETLALGRIAALVLIMLSAYKGGITWGAIAGIAFGTVMDAAAYQTLNGEPFFIACYGITGLAAGIFAKTGKLSFILTYIIANAIAAFWNWTSPMREPALYETFAASVIFFILPNSVLTKYKERVLSAELGFIRGLSSISNAAARYTREKAACAGAAFGEIHGLLETTLSGETNDNDISSVFDVAADSVCRKCRRSAVCWSSNYEDTKTILNDTTLAMQQRGRVSSDDFAPRFREKCENFQNFIAAINSELKAVMLRRMYRAKLRDCREAVYSQFADMSNILYGVSDAVGVSEERAESAEQNINLWLTGIGLDARASAFCDGNQRVHIDVYGDDLSALRHTDDWLDKLSAAAEILLTLSESSSPDHIELTECEPLSASIGIASLRKRGEDVSGDNGTFFKTDDGILHVILSDGMGSGDPAARDSAAAVRILERFLRAGVHAETALKVVGSVMTLRSEESIGCATIDLLCLNLFNGEGKLYKYGAAPSYIRRGNSVRRVSGDTLSAGLARNDPECTKLWLEPGSFAVIVSDGVAGPDDDWLSAYLAGYSYTGNDLPKELARELIETAIERAGSEAAPDDMTSLVVALNC
ncbi:MAG: SpoIIE family protein phosphatase [Oscillospiraceae bacterium]|nr:SpoIIE family protein phosphatase [Oscillospiraceae bacterium]